MTIHEIDTQWMDVKGVKPYPVFNALKGTGTNGKFTFPDQAKNPYPDRPNNPATSGSSTTTRRSSRPPATCIRAALDRPQR